MVINVMMVTTGEAVEAESIPYMERVQTEVVANCPPDRSNSAV